MPETGADYSPRTLTVISSVDEAERLQVALGAKDRWISGQALTWTGLTAHIAAGVDILGGRYVEFGSSVDKTLTASATNYIYAKNDATYVVNQTGVAPSDSVLLHIAVTNGSTVSGTPTDSRDDTLDFDVRIKAYGADFEDREVTNVGAPTAADSAANKSYVDTAIAAASQPDASTTVKGITKLSVAPASPTSPIAVGDNDSRATDVTAATAAATINTLVRRNGSGQASFAAAASAGQALIHGQTAAGDLTGTYPSPTIAANAVGDTKLRDSAALSVIGRSANSTGDPADIVTNADGDVLRRNGTTLEFSQVGSTSIANDAVTNAKLANMSSATVKGQTSGGSGDPVDLTAAQLVTIVNTADGSGSGLDADLLDGLNTASAATVSTVMTRDSNGRSNVVAGTTGNEVVNYGQVPGLGAAATKGPSTQFNLANGLLSGQTKYAAMYGWATNTSTDTAAVGNESDVEMNAAGAFTITKIRVTTKTANGGGTLTITLRKNGAATGLSVSWSNGEAASSKTASGTVTVADGDRLCWEINSGGTNPYIILCAA